MDGFDDVVGALALHVEAAVQRHDHHAAHQTHEAADAQSFGQRRDIEGDMLKETFDAFHGVLLCGGILMLTHAFFRSLRYFNTRRGACQSAASGGLHDKS